MVRIMVIIKTWIFDVWEKQFSLQFLHKIKAVDSWLSHVHTGYLWVVWASERCETLLNSRHFVNFAAVVLQVRLFELHRHSRAPRRTYSDCMFPLQWRFACVHVRVCTCVLTQECGFVLYPPSVAFLWGIFPDSFSYCCENPYTRCFLGYNEKPRFVVKYVCLIHVAKL